MLLLIDAKQFIQENAFELQKIVNVYIDTPFVKC